MVRRLIDRPVVGIGLPEPGLDRRPVGKEPPEAPSERGFPEAKRVEDAARDRVLVLALHSNWARARWHPDPILPGPPHLVEARASHPGAHSVGQEEEGTDAGLHGVFPAAGTHDRGEARHRLGQGLELLRGEVVDREDASGCRHARQCARRAGAGTRSLGGV